MSDFDVPIGKILVFVLIPLWVPVFIGLCAWKIAQELFVRFLTDD